MKSHKLYDNISQSLLQWNEIITMMEKYHQTFTDSPPLMVALPSPECPNIKFKPGITLENTLMLQDINTVYPDRINLLYDVINISSFAQEKANNQYINEVTLYFSFLPEAYTHGIHRDRTDVYIWQQQGEIEIDVYDKTKHSYTLSPGDLIFIPEGMYHDVRPQTARATLSFAFFRDEESGIYPTEEYYKRNNVDTSEYSNPFNSIFNLK